MSKCAAERKKLKKLNKTPALLNVPVETGTKPRKTKPLMGLMQNNLLLGNSTVAAGYVSVARDVSAIRTSARENSFTGSSFKEGIPETVKRKRMPNIRFTENRLLATKSYPAATEIDVILHKCHCCPPLRKVVNAIRLSDGLDKVPPGLCTPVGKRDVPSQILEASAVCERQKAEPGTFDRCMGGFLWRNYQLIIFCQIICCLLKSYDIAQPNCVVTVIHFFSFLVSLSHH